LGRKGKHWPRTHSLSSRQLLGACGKQGFFEPGGKSRGEGTGNRLGSEGLGPNPTGKVGLTLGHCTSRQRWSWESRGLGGCRRGKGTRLGRRPQLCVSLKRGGRTEAVAAETQASATRRVRSMTAVAWGGSAVGNSWWGGARDQRSRLIARSHSSVRVGSRCGK
jgi:hypothetical protein